MYFRTVKVTIKEIIEIFKQYRYTKGVLEPFVPEDIDPFLHKSFYVYTTLIPNLIGFPWMKMMDVKITDKKREMVTLMSALIPLNDEFTDKMGNSIEYVDNFFYNYKTVTPQNAHEKMQIDLLNRVMELSENEEELLNAFEKIHKAQLESIKQHTSTDSEEIKQITADKGGYTAQLFLTAVSDDIDDQMFEAAYELGTWFQYGDDMIDIEADRKAGINTPATQAEDWEKHTKKLDKEYVQMQESIKALPYDENKKDDFLFTTYYFLQLGIIFFGTVEERRQMSLPRKYYEFFIGVGLAFYRTSKYQY